jgi:hypothetical protein
MTHPFPNAVHAGEASVSYFDERKRGAMPFKFVPHPESGWLVSCAWGPDPLDHYKFGVVFHVPTEELSDFLTNAFIDWHKRMLEGLARGEAIRAARANPPTERPKYDPIDFANIELKL